MGSGATGSGRGARPTVTRRREVSDASARSLLTTVLGEYVLPQGEPVWTQTIVDVLGRFEIEEKSARQALARVAAEGWLSSERVGRHPHHRSCSALSLRLLLRSPRFRVRVPITPAGRQQFRLGGKRSDGTSLSPQRRRLDDVDDVEDDGLRHDV